MLYFGRGVESFVFDESWEIIRKVFPVDLEELARESGSFRRARIVGDAETLLRLLLMHGSGLSLEQTVLRAKGTGGRDDQRGGALQALTAQ